MTIDAVELLNYAIQYEGIRDLISLYINEEDVAERDHILEDIKDLILSIRGIL